MFFGPPSYETRTEPTPRSRFGCQYMTGFVSYVFRADACGWVFAAFATTQADAERQAKRWIDAQPRYASGSPLAPTE
jgi:hypothetical protein